MLNITNMIAIRLFLVSIFRCLSLEMALILMMTHFVWGNKKEHEKLSRQQMCIDINLKYRYTRIVEIF